MAWPEEVERTWLANEAACAAMDLAVERRAAGHRGPSLRPNELLHLRIGDAATFVKTIGPSPRNSVYVSVVLSLLGEMLLCIEMGGIFHGSVTECLAGSNDPHLWKAAEALRLLRNTLCHPAAHDRQHGPLAVDAFVDHVEKESRDEVWPVVVRGRPAALADRTIASFALRQIDTVGRAKAAVWGVGLRGFSRRPATAHRR